MAFYLTFDGANDYVLAPFNESMAQTFEIELKFRSFNGTQLSARLLTLAGTGSRPLITISTGGQSLTDDNLEFFFSSDGNVNEIVRTTSNAEAAPFGDGLWHTLIVYMRNGAASFSYDGGAEVSIGSYTSTNYTVTQLTLGAVFRSSASNFLEHDLAHVIFRGDITRNYDSSASAGTGLVLPDTLGNGSTDGTLTNFDGVTDSWWVFYSDGGATFTLALDAGTYVYTGNTFDLSASRNVSLDAGSYAYTGQDLDLSFGRNVSLDAGSYSYTGQDIDLSAARNVSLDAGSYDYTGQDINLKADRNVLLDAGTYSYSGQDSTIKADRNVSFDAGSYAYTGQDLTLVYTPVGGPTYLISLDAGSYQITGNDITLAANRAILLDAGGYSYTGQSVVLAANRKLSLDAGSYSITGEDVTLTASRSVSFEVGTYGYSGVPMVLDYSGEIISLMSQYSVKYTKDDVNATYSNEFITARFL